MEQNTKNRQNIWAEFGVTLRRPGPDDPIFNEPVRFSTMRRTRLEESSQSNTEDSTETSVSKDEKP